MLTVTKKHEEMPATGGSLLDEVVRDGARRTFAAALEAEAAVYIEAHVDQVDEDGRPGGPQRVGRAAAGADLLGGDRRGRAAGQRQTGRCGQW